MITRICLPGVSQYTEKTTRKKNKNAAELNNTRGV